MGAIETTSAEQQQKAQADQQIGEALKQSAFQAAGITTSGLNVNYHERLCSYGADLSRGIEHSRQR